MCCLSYDYSGTGLECSGTPKRVECAEQNTGAGQAGRATGSGVLGLIDRFRLSPEQDVDELFNARRVDVGLETPYWYARQHPSKKIEFACPHFRVQQARRVGVHNQ